MWYNSLLLTVSDVTVCSDVLCLIGISPIDTYLFCGGLDYSIMPKKNLSDSNIIVIGVYLEKMCSLWCRAPLSV